MEAHFHSCAGLGGGIWLLTHFTTPTSHLSLAHFLITLHTYLGLSHLIVAHLLCYWCGHTIYDLGTHLLRCLCGSEHIITHNIFQHIVIVITLENGTHVQREVSHLFLCHIQ